MTVGRKGDRRKKDVWKDTWICTGPCDYSKEAVCQVPGGPVLKDYKCQSKKEATRGEGDEAARPLPRGPSASRTR